MCSLINFIINDLVNLIIILVFSFWFCDVKIFFVGI